MGTNAALMTQKVIDNSFEVLSIHMIAIAQALDISDNLVSVSSATREFHSFVRAEVPMLTDDVSLHDPMATLKQKLLTTEKKLF